MFAGGYHGFASVLEIKARALNTIGKRVPLGCTSPQAASCVLYFWLLDEPWLGNVFVISRRVAERMYEGVRNGPVWGALRMWSLECARAVEGTGLRHRL